MPRGKHRGTCSLDGCDQPHYGLGWCRTHHARFVRNGHLEIERVIRTRCEIEGCDEPHKARGLCSTHYKRWLRAR